MSYSYERQTLIEYFFNNFDADTTPVKVGNVKELSTNNSLTYQDETGLDEWCRISIEPISAIQADMNATRRIRHTGLLDISVFVKTGVGEGRALELIDTINDMFKLNTIDKITCRAGNVNKVGEISGFYQISITFEYQRDDF